MSYRHIWTDYEVKARPIEPSETDAEGWTWYWDLYVGNQKVNGGLGKSEWDARGRAKAYLYFVGDHKPFLRDQSYVLQGTFVRHVECTGDPLL